jgi:hypothetical protein
MNNERTKERKEVEPIIVEVFMDAQVAQKRKVGIVKLDMTHTAHDTHDTHTHTQYADREQPVAEGRYVGHMYTLK